MIRWFLRLVLLRFLPRRLLPILTLIEVVRLVRGLRSRPSSAPAGRPVSRRSTDAPEVRARVDR